MASRHLNKARAVPAFANTFATALRQFSDAFFETAGVGHTTLKGTLRENALGEYLTRRLPGLQRRLGRGCRSAEQPKPAVDVMIYDQSENFSFQAGGNAVILPAEAC